MLLEVVVKLESELFIVTVSHLLIIFLMLAILLRLYWGSVLSESPVWLVNQSALLSEGWETHPGQEKMQFQ